MTLFILSGIYFLVFLAVSWTVRLVVSSTRPPEFPFAAIAGQARTISSAIRFPGISRYKEAIDRLSLVAGHKSGSEEFLFNQVLSALSGAGVGLLFIIFVWNRPGSSGIVLVLMGLVSGAAYPWLRLREAVRVCQKGMLRELSWYLDLMVLGVEAGMDYNHALIKILDGAPISPLRERFEAMSRELQMGKIRSEAWKEFARKCGLPEIQSMTLIFIQADQSGSPVAETLRSLSDRIREDRFRQAERTAHRMPVKLLLPLLGFIFPAVFILLFFPLVVRLLQIL